MWALPSSLLPHSAPPCAGRGCARSAARAAVRVFDVASLSVPERLVDLTVAVVVLPVARLAQCRRARTQAARAADLDASARVAVGCANETAELDAHRRRVARAQSARRNAARTADVRRTDETRRARIRRRRRTRDRATTFMGSSDLAASTGDAQCAVRIVRAWQAQCRKIGGAIGRSNQVRPGWTREDPTLGERL